MNPEWHGVMILDKVCKHVVRYATSEEGAPVSTVYVSKTFLGHPAPKSIRVVVQLQD